LEPEEKTAPGGLHAFTTYNLHALNNAFAISVVLGLIYLLESVLGMTTESPYESIQPTLSLLDDPIYLLLFFGVLVVGAPVFEELVFRRTLIPLLERRGLGHFWVLVLSSLVFSLRHTPADLIDGSLGYAILHVFVTLPGGLALGFLYLRTRNVIWPIILHALINGLSGLAQIAEVQYNELGDLVLLTFVGLWAMAAVFIGFAAMLYFSYQFLLRRRDEIKPTWMQIIMDTSKNNRNLSKISRYLIIFILFTGGVPIIFSLLRENLLPPTISSPSDIDQLLLIYFVEIVFNLLIIFLAFLFIRNVTSPILKPVFVSSTLTLIDKYIPQPYFSPRPQQIQEKQSRATCKECGNIILENAKFCAYCGVEYSEENNDPLI
jgi:membrane protease YdiL (CAAX protease family)